MRKFFTILLLTVSAVAFLVAVATAGADKPATASKDKPAHEFVGAKKCKACHKDVYAAWAETPHATAFDVLSDTEKKDAACIGCHSSGETAKGLNEGVQCEACHGAGKDYKSAKIMNKKKWAADPEAQRKMATEAGLIMPTEEDCTRCHKEEGNKNFKPFKFAERKDSAHPVAKK